MAIGNLLLLALRYETHDGKFAVKLKRADLKRSELCHRCLAKARITNCLLALVLRMHIFADR
jgi:hypothetical protein